MMKTEIGFIDKSELFPGKGEMCGECRDKGLNICDLDEICQERLAEAIGKEQVAVVASIDHAMEKGLLEVRLARVKGKSMRFVKLSGDGRLFFGVPKE